MNEKQLHTEGELLSSQTPICEITEQEQQELAENLAKEITPEEYFRDLEKTGKYPKEIEEAWKLGHPKAFLRVLEKKGVNIIPSSVELLGFLPKEKHLELRKLAQNHFGTYDLLVNYSGDGEIESSDGADLFTIVRRNGKYYLVKLACGEFNRKTFTEGSMYCPKVKLHKSEIPLFVVNQLDSYFATGGKNQADIRNVDVRLYLDLYATIVSLETGEAEKRGNFIKNKVPLDWSQIRIPEYEELKSILEEKIDDNN